ncbi:tyrosine-type recombinase/integrase [Mesorhizobium amorphae]|uniref:tyrosine-type recombinase/integrase n=1 Tax=Mesorhizobium amorphae TaxID=71433 RepID=UPI00177C5FD3|nr:integrase family protein [Mesorhizobium amorphae]
MTRRRKFSDTGVEALKPKAARYTSPDPEMRGHYVRVMPSGAKSFVAVARDPNGKQVWATIGAADKMGIEKARTLARDAIERIRQGLPPVEQKAAPVTFNDVQDGYLKRHVVAKGLLSEYEIRRCLDVYVIPQWGKREFVSIRRGDVAALLDKIEDENGARQADSVLAIVRGVCNWFAARNDNYVSPIVRGMRRTVPKDRARERILTDDEIRVIWKHSEGTFGAMMQLALATAQRREKLMTIKWDDVSIDGVWHVPSDDREKGTGGDLKLSALALEIIRNQSRIGKNPYVFAGRGDGHFNGMSRAKINFDKRVKEEAQAKLAPWVIHDLRRTGRSLMSRAGVRPDIAERVLGHVIGGVEGIYDRHAYRDEKGDALERLGALLDTIIKNDPSANVVPIRKAAQ